MMWFFVTQGEHQYTMGDRRAPQSSIDDACTLHPVFQNADLAFNLCSYPILSYSFVPSFLQPKASDPSQLPEPTNAFNFQPPTPGHILSLSPHILLGVLLSTLFPIQPSTLLPFQSSIPPPPPRYQGPPSSPRYAIDREPAWVVNSIASFTMRPTRSITARGKGHARSQG